MRRRRGVRVVPVTPQRGVQFEPGRGQGAGFLWPECLPYHITLRRRVGADATGKERTTPRRQRCHRVNGNHPPRRLDWSVRHAVGGGGGVYKGQRVHANFLPKNRDTGGVAGFRVRAVVRGHAVFFFRSHAVVIHRSHTTVPQPPQPTRRAFPARRGPRVCFSGKRGRVVNPFPGSVRPGVVRFSFLFNFRSIHEPVHPAAKLSARVSAQHVSQHERPWYLCNVLTCWVAEF
mmetsp:Transcript_7492/g.28141  ORF Transcript_7492/g.28141 Transcript_7492/m.28141 type:complete len:232 (+) Transcript_7492:900-1595(+)